VGRGLFPERLLHAVNLVPNNSVLVHRDVLETVGLYDPHLCLARYCDWDLWRRITTEVPLLAVDVPVGVERGPATADSYSLRYPVDPWLAWEWMARPRNEALLAQHMPDYDVQAIPRDLSPAASRAMALLARHWADRSWFVDVGSTASPARCGGARPGVGCSSCPISSTR
jgi:hypothetical protein